MAFAEAEPPTAVNLVHPRPVAWKILMQPVVDRIFKLNITSNPMPLAPFSDWLEKLESSAKNASEETIKRIVIIAAQCSASLYRCDRGRTCDVVIVDIGKV